jgi:hypothetical protein
MRPGTGKVFFTKVISAMEESSSTGRKQRGEENRPWAGRCAKLEHRLGIQFKGNRTLLPELVGFIRSRMSADPTTPGYTVPNKGSVDDVKAGKKCLIQDAFVLLGKPDLMKPAVEAGISAPDLAGSGGGGGAATDRGASTGAAISPPSSGRPPLPSELGREVVEQILDTGRALFESPLNEPVLMALADAVAKRAWARKKRMLQKRLADVRKADHPAYRFFMSNTAAMAIVVTAAGHINPAWAFLGRDDCFLADPRMGAFRALTEEERRNGGYLTFDKLRSMWIRAGKPDRVDGIVGRLEEHHADSKKPGTTHRLHCLYPHESLPFSESRVPKGTHQMLDWFIALSFDSNRAATNALSKPGLFAWQRWKEHVWGSPHVNTAAYFELMLPNRHHIERRLCCWVRAVSGGGVAQRAVTKFQSHVS